MAICSDPNCGCAIVGGSGVSVSGSGTGADPWVLNVVEPTEIADLEADVADLQVALLTLPAIYVDAAGDTMTGMLKVRATGSALRLIRTSGDSPYMEWYTADELTRLAYIQATTSLLTVASDGGDVRISPTTNTLLGKATSGVATVGVEASNTGTLSTTRGDSFTNYVANKTSTGATDSGAAFASWQVLGTQIGSITRNTTTSAVLYNTTSDADLKENFTLVDDELALLWMRLIQPGFFNFKGHPDVVQVGYLAQPSIELWPNAEQHGVITRGHGNVEDRTWDEDGNETTPPEAWEPWQMDYGRIGAFVHGAVQALDRIVQARTEVLDDHETRIDTLETASPVALEARVAALETLVTGQATQIADLQATVTAQAAEIAALETSGDAVGLLRNEVYYTRQMTAGWQYSNTTGTPPAAGQLRSNTPLTNLYVNKVDTDGFNRSAALNYIVTSTLYKHDSARIRLRGANGSVFEVRSNGAATDNGTWVSIPVTIVSGTEGSKGTRIEVTMLSEIWAEDPPPMPTNLPAQPQPDVVNPQDSGS